MSIRNLFMKSALFVLLITITINTFAELSWKDPLPAELKTTKEDAVTGELALKNLNKKYDNIATTNYNHGNYRLAIEYYLKSKNISETLNNKSNVANTCKQIACCYQLMGNYEKAMESILQALRLFERLKDYSLVSNCYNDMGNFYVEHKDFKNALDCFHKALKINIENGYEKTLPDIYTNIGSALLNMGKVHESLDYYRKALELYEKEKNEKGIAINFTNIAFALAKSGKYAQSIDYNTRAIDILKKIDFKMGLVYTLCNVSELYTLKGDYGKSIEYGKEALSLAKETKLLYIEEQANLSLSVACEKLRNDKQALFYFKEHARLSDSLLNQQKQKQITELRIEYETETLEKQKQIAEQEKELLEIKTSRQKVWELLLLSVIGIITTSLIVVLIQKRNQMKSNNMLVVKNLEIVKSERLLYEKKKELESIIDSYRSQNINDDPIYTEKYSQSKLDKTDEKLLLESIEKLMTEDKLFLQSDLSLDKLAKQLGTNRSYLSQVINDHYKQNFNNFLNQYRIKEVCYLLSNPVNQNKTIEGIAQEVGFNSITTFNRCFKKHTGVNPSIYMKFSRPE